MPIGNTKVTVNLTAFVVDTSDTDEEPDETPMVGTLLLEPQTTKGPIQFDDAGVTKLKAIIPITVPIGVNGNIAHEGRDYVRVLAPTPAESNITDLIQYKATFSGLKVGGLGGAVVTVPPIFFTATPGTTVNLADELNVSPTAGVTATTRGPRGYGIDSIEDVGGAIIVTYLTEDGPVESDPIPIGGAGPDTVRYVNVITGSEGRPVGATFVQWVDTPGRSGTTAPSNMDDNDIWLKRT